MFLSILSNAQVLILHIHDQMHCYVLLVTKIKSTFNEKYKNVTYTVAEKVKAEFITYISAHVKFSLKTHSKYTIMDCIA